MLDNMTIDRLGRVWMQEDVGNAVHNSKIWMYEIATDELTEIAKHDLARFGDLGMPATAPFTMDEESSEIIDVSRRPHDYHGTDLARWSWVFGGFDWTPDIV